MVILTVLTEDLTLLKGLIQNFKSYKHKYQQKKHKYLSNHNNLHFQ